MSKMVRVRMVKSVRPGAVLEVYPGVAEQWIMEGRAVAEPLTPQRSTEERMVPQGRKQRRMNA